MKHQRHFLGDGWDGNDCDCREGWDGNARRGNDTKSLVFVRDGYDDN